MRTTSSLLFGLPLSLIPAVALAQTAAPAPSAQARPSAPAATRQQQMDAEDAEQQEIVVRGSRPAGSVIGDIPPEVTLTPADIRSYGVNNISDLLDQLTPQTGNGRGGQPVILLSGRRISSFLEIRDLPTEAILRTEVLPQEVSLKYGYSADQRVVNIVLRPRFRAMITQGGGSIATDGGGENVNPEFNLIRINRDRRLSVNLRYQDTAAIKESERGIVYAPGTTDLSDFRTLRSSSEQYSGNIVYAQPVFGRSTASLSGSLAYTQGNGLQGVSPAAPTDPLHQRTENLTSHAGVSVNGDRGSWRWSLTGNYDGVDSKTRTERGPGVLDRAHSIANSGDFNALIGGPLARLPAGQLSTTLRAGFDIDEFDATSVRSGVSQKSDLSRRNANGQINLDIPIASARENFLPFLGQLSANFNANVRQLSDFGTLHTIGYGMFWTPIKPLNFLVSVTQNQGAPTVQQLGNPLVVTPQVRVFDYQRGTTVDVTQIGGGNANLLANDSHTLRLNMTAKPFPKSDFTFTANYTHTNNKNSIANLPEPTSDIEAAFPDRFVRNASGQLVSIDVRPVNFQRESEDTLRMGFNFSVPLKSIMQRKFEQFIADRRAGKNVPFPIQISEAQRKRFEQLQQRQNGNRPAQAGQNGQAAPAGGQAAPAGQGAQGTPPAPGATGGQSPGGVIFGGGQGGPPPGAMAFTMAQGGPPGGGAPGGGAPGGGPGGGGFRGFNGGGGGFGAAAAGRLQIALYDSWTIKDTVSIRPGVPLIDLLRGGSVGAGGGTPEHQVELQLGYSNNGLGVRLSGNWQSGTTVKAGLTSTTGDLTFKPLTTATLRIFADVGQMPMFIGKEWARGLRVNFTLSNIANARQKVYDQTGNTPLRYQPAYLDALGRTVGVTIRKLWL